MCFSQVANGILWSNGNLQLSTLMVLAEEGGVWNNDTLCSLLSDSMPDVEKGKKKKDLIYHLVLSYYPLFCHNHLENSACNTYQVKRTLLERCKRRVGNLAYITCLLDDFINEMFATFIFMDFCCPQFMNF